MRFRIICLFIVVFLFFIIIVAHLNSYPKVKEVSTIPPNFIFIDDVISSDSRNLEYTFFESQIAFLDSQGICIYQTDVRNSEFIIQYEGKYYIRTQEDGSPIF